MRIALQVLMWLGIVLLVVLLAAAATFGYLVRKSFPQVDGTLQVSSLSKDVDVIRDERGIPNIYADNVPDLYTALGYTHAQDRFWEMDFRRHITAGRLSEMFGKTRVDTDTFLRTLGWRRVAEQEYQMLNETSKQILTSYAKGVNEYLQEKSPSDISFEYVILGLQNSSYEIEQWDPVDSIAWLKALAWDLRGNMNQEIARVLTANNVGIKRTQELFPPYPYQRVGTIVSDAEESLATKDAEAAASVVDDDAAAAFARVETGVRTVDGVLGLTGEGIGSDSWVADGSLSETGKPILANDPHLGPAMPSLWYQAGLHCRTVTDECPYDVSGWTMAGLPGVFIGHNADISWGFTNLGPDVTDLVLEKVDGDHYVVDGKKQKIETRDETIKVAGGDDVALKVRSTANGPILSDVPGSASDTYTEVGQQAPVPAPGQQVAPSKEARGDGYAVSLRWTALTPRPMFDALDIIDTARNWEEFREAAELLAVPSQNLIYADTKGNIGFQAPGAIPIRTGYDGKWPVPGWDSSFKWTGIIPFEKLPKTYNPPHHWITTANQAVVPKDYPVTVQADVYSYGARASRINTRIAAIVDAGKKLTKQDMADIQMDAGNELAEFLAANLKSYEPGGAADEAVKLFEGWDAQQPIDSAPGAYFNVFYTELTNRMFNDELPDQAETAANAGDQFWEVIRVLWDDPSNKWWDDTNTDGKESRDDTVNASLSAAADWLSEQQGADPNGWNWGDLHTLTVKNQTLGDSGIGPIERIFNRGPVKTGGGGSIPLATGWQPTEGYEVTWVPSMRQVVDMSNLDNSTWVNLTGNSGHTYNSNYVDQLDAWVTGEQFPWLFSEQAIKDSGTNNLRMTPNSE